MKGAQLRLQPYQIAALRAGNMTELRRAIVASNSMVLPGTFEGLSLDTGRTRTLSTLPSVTELRAPCRLTGSVRVVSVQPRQLPGDLFWISPPASRAESRLTLLLTTIRAARVQDMTHLDAEAEGVGHARGMPGTSPREKFASLWDMRQGVGSWAANGWVWVYRFNLWRKNVDRVIAQL